MLGEIYIIVNQVNGKKYIGLTTNNIYFRFKRHLSNAVNNNYSITSKLYRAIRKYGEENFSVKSICECYSQCDLEWAEGYFIDYYDSIQLGYNIRAGGLNGKKAKITFSKEWKENLSKSHKGQKVLESTKIKIGNALRGSKHYKWVDVPVDKIIHLYQNENLSLKKIAKRLGFGTTTIKRRLLQASVELKKSNGYEKNINDDVIRLFNENKSDTEIATELKVGRVTVWKRRKILGLERQARCCSRLNRDRNL